VKLETLRHASGYFALLSLDQPLGLAEAGGWDITQTSAGPILNQLYQTMVKSWSAYATGVIADPWFGLPAIVHKAKGVGVALQLEQSMTASDPLSPPKLTEDWSVSEIAANYAVAKVYFPFHASEEQAAAKLQWLAEIADYCRYEQIDLIVVHSLPNIPDLNAAPDQALLEALQELQPHVRAVVIDPVADALVAATLTAELDIPWLVNLDAAQGEYAQVKDLLRLSLENGAKGWLGGQVFWQGLGMPAGHSSTNGSANLETVIEFLNHEAQDRVIELSRIARETVTAAAPTDSQEAKAPRHKS
jgi:tagatose-1,6-bisphosphate aldolase